MKTAVVLFLMILSFVANAQNSIEPAWLNTTTESFTGKFQYFVGISNHVRLDTARSMAFDDVIQKISEYEGNTYEVESVSETKIENIHSNGGVNTKTNFSYSGTVKSAKTKVTKNIREIETYRKGNELYALYRVCDQKTNIDVPIYAAYTASEMWYRSLIPGLGQFHKTENRKGVFFASGVMALGIGSLSSHLAANYYNDQALKNIHNYDDYAWYLDRSDRMTTVRNVGLGITGVFYLYNIVDAFVSKGTPRYTMNKQFKVNIIANNGDGLGIGINF